MTKRTKSRKSWIRWIVILLVLTALAATLPTAVDRTERWLYPMEYTAVVNEAAMEYDIAPSLIFAVIHTESHFVPEAVSSAGAKGLMQLTDDTYQWARRRSGEKKGDPQDLFDPEINIHYGVTVLSLLQQIFADTETVLAAYNAGQGRVSGWLEDPAYSHDGVTLHTIPYEETADYVRRVLTAQQRYQRLYNIP